ncbi:hypothetical protein ABL850_32095 [Variovorax paradoxus]|jgi:hypothetical protein|uniref:hypothetical protein n=1 Tax=Variovorax paradoxus TaxID=34073 RepID=UPI0003737A70|nr:hypothetical protein [Variovorax paradoxus]
MKSEEIPYICGSLRVSLQLIDRAIARLDASRPFPRHPHRIHLIRAMVELLEVLESLRSTGVEMPERSAVATRLESSYNETFRGAVIDAQALEVEGSFENAAQRYRQFLQTCRSHPHCALALSEFQRLQSMAEL